MGHFSRGAFLLLKTAFTKLYGRTFYFLLSYWQYVLFYNKFVSNVTYYNYNVTDTLLNLQVSTY